MVYERSSSLQPLRVVSLSLEHVPPQKSRFSALLPFVVQGFGVFLWLAALAHASPKMLLSSAFSAPPLATTERFRAHPLPETCSLLAPSFLLHPDLWRFLP